MASLERLQQLGLRLFDRVLLLQVSRFAIIGAVNTGVDFGVFLFALKFLTSSLVAANILSWTVAVSGSYVMNCFITFAALSGRRLRLRDYARFVGAGLFGLAGNTAMLVTAARVLALPVIPAKVLAIGVSFLINFSLARLVVFRPRHSPRAELGRARSRRWDDGTRSQASDADGSLPRT